MPWIVDQSGARETEPSPPRERGDPGPLGFFETLRVERRSIHLYHFHMDRLEAACQHWGLKLPCTRFQILPSLSNEISAAAGDYHRIRITAIPENEYALIGTGVFPGQLLLEASPLDQTYTPSIMERPMLEVAIAASQVVYTGARLQRNKNTWNRAAYFEERERVRAMGFDDALLLNERNEIVESTIFNVFWFVAGTLMTPAAECGPLPGIFATYLDRMASRLSIPVQAVRAQPDDLTRADAVFLTNSLGEMIGVSRLDDLHFDDPRRHAVLAPLFEAVEAQRPNRADAVL